MQILVIHIDGDKPRPAVGTMYIELEKATQEDIERWLLNGYVLTTEEMTQEEYHAIGATPGSAAFFTTIK